MGGVTLNDVGETAKLITAIIACISGIAGMFTLALKTYLKPISSDIESIKKDINTQINDINDIKTKVDKLTDQYDELETKAKSNRKLDNLLVKTMLLILDTNDKEQNELKNEINNLIINEATN